jgi:hypothetical protein
MLVKVLTKLHAWTPTCKVACTDSPATLLSSYHETLQVSIYNIVNDLTLQNG